MTFNTEFEKALRNIAPFSEGEMTDIKCTDHPFGMVCDWTNPKNDTHTTIKIIPTAFTTPHISLQVGGYDTETHPAELAKKLIKESTEIQEKMQWHVA
jgi:hypothetical protein